MRAIELSILSIQRAIEVLDLSSLPSTQPLIIADFDLSHGFNSMYAMKRRLVLVINNNLSTNNWTILFDLLNKDTNYKWSIIL
ncbi:unnamed protein product [Rotaria sp. Silwood1]|nr:unnamed protein product [Rotaria sp. Silwood1]